MKQPSATAIGAFVVGAIALLVLSILMFSKQRFFESAEQKVAYFEGSTNGLAVGAPVRLKGVKIGSVTRIVLQFQVDELVFRSAVFFELPKRELLQMVAGQNVDNLDADEIIKRLIDQRGLRAQLMPQSLVTGQLYLGLDFFPNTPVKLYGELDGVHELPTIRSNTDRILESITKGISDLDELPLTEIASQALKTLKTIEKAVNPEELTSTMQSFQSTLRQVDKTIQKLDHHLGPIAVNLEGTLTETRSLVSGLSQRMETVGESADVTLVELQQTLKLAQGTLAQLDQNSQFSTQLTETLREVSAAARSLRYLSDELRQQPQSILFGKDTGASAK
ncbi:MAG: MlaD family protein [Methylococcales bacterium]